MREPSSEIAFLVSSPSALLRAESGVSCCSAAFALGSTLTSCNCSAAGLSADHSYRPGASGAVGVAFVKGTALDVENDVAEVGGGAFQGFVVRCPINASFVGSLSVLDAGCHVRRRQQRRVTRGGDAAGEVFAQIGRLFRGVGRGFFTRKRGEPARLDLKTRFEQRPRQVGREELILLPIADRDTGRGFTRRRDVPIDQPSAPRVARICASLALPCGSLSVGAEVMYVNAPPSAAASINPGLIDRFDQRAVLVRRGDQLPLAVVGEGGGARRPVPGGRVVKVASALAIVSGAASVAITRKW